VFVKSQLALTTTQVEGTKVPVYIYIQDMLLWVVYFYGWGGIFVCVTHAFDRYVPCYGFTECVLVNALSFRVSCS
jgi:hypothetical protein